MSGLAAVCIEYGDDFYTLTILVCMMPFLEEGLWERSDARGVFGTDLRT